ncbi:MAG: DUF721 domain-containing protein [Alphaproteobacteria bacterium]|nr:DUF721 domain-containing protein [Alphaproteobacteria bacterium]
MQISAKNLKQLMRQVLKPVLEKRGFSERRLLQNWAEIAGPDFSSRCTPLKLSYPGPENKNGQLHLGAFHAHNTELLHQTPQLLERVNRFLGYEAVTSIRLHPLKSLDSIVHQQKLTPTTSGELPKHVEQFLNDQISDPKLRENLKTLGQYIRSEQS